MRPFWLYFGGLCLFMVFCDVQAKASLKIVTVASERTDGYLRYLRSAKIYGYNVETLGLGEEWKGGDIVRFPGGAYKINLFKKWLKNYENDKDLIVAFTDSYDVLFSASSKELLKRFKKSGKRILFSAEAYCWPNGEMADQYPPVSGPYRYLNSGAYMGYAADLYKLLSIHALEDKDDDQLYFTNMYLDEVIRKKLKIGLDTHCEIFQSLNGADGEYLVKFRNDDAYLFNEIHANEPIVIHGNGLSKVQLNSLSNYLAKSFTIKRGCLACEETLVPLEKLREKPPKITIGVFIVEATPFIDEFLQNIISLDYPKDMISLYIYNPMDYHKEALHKFVDQDTDEYAKFEFLGVNGAKEMCEVDARNTAVSKCAADNCDYYLSIDAEARFTSSESLFWLLSQNRSIIAPMMTRWGKLWSNFWGALSDNGYYARSDDYMDIVEYKKIGIWNVPYISSTYLIRSDVLKRKDFPPFRFDADRAVDMNFCKDLRDNNHFFYVTNQQYYGHLISPDNFDPTKKNADFFETIENPVEWKERYIHKEYLKIFEENGENIIEQPCPDVFWFPVVSERYCTELIEILEDFGEWSSGTNEDTRLSGGYENVPTRDIHMTQIGYEKQWLYFLKEFIRPVQEMKFIGYFHDPPVAALNFVVRYRPDEQPSLRPHHDASTYTVNIALNRAGIDYEGGGCKFIRYDCSVINTRMGWSFIHPGRLTHYHEGLLTTKGTRYIQISFVDP